MVSADLPDPFEQLVAFGQRPDAKIRPVLLRVLVDMFVSKPNHGTSELRQFEEIVAHLLDDADDETRLAVAEQLSKHAQTPPALLDRFVAERSSIAAKVLAKAGMDQRTLNAAAVYGTALMAEAVARRTDIGGGVVRCLAERPEVEVLCALVENRSAAIDRPLFRYLSRRAQGHPQLAARLLDRGETSETESLFLAAGRAQRAEMIAEARRQELAAGARPSPLATSDETIASIERAARLPGLEGLEGALVAALRCPPQDVARLVDDPQGEPFAILLAALGVPADVAARIFILGSPSIGHSYTKVKRLVGIVETVPSRAAARLLAVMLGRPTDAARRVVSASSDGLEVRRGEAGLGRREAQPPQPLTRRLKGAG